ncbi:hypothetical protein AC1031_011378 [Aphanomyces cochlioides]|nr:hypothetical protein AC1031_011378 [Aphanomyces cochlioides]
MPSFIYWERFALQSTSDRLNICGNCCLSASPTGRKTGYGRSDEVTCNHIKGIAKYYSATGVGNLWIPRHRFIGLLPPETMTLSDHITETLSYVEHLTDLQHSFCSPAAAASILKFAASSVYLRDLYLRSTFSGTDTCSTITTAMAVDFLQWVVSRSIRRLELYCFKWEDESLRNTVMETALGSKDFEILRIEQENLPGVVMSWNFHTRPNQLFLGFRYLSTFASEALNIDDLRGFIYLFGPSLPTKIKVLVVEGLQCAGGGTVWVDLAGLFQSSQVERFEIRSSKLASADEGLIADAIRDHSMIQHLVLLGSLSSFDGAVAVLKAAPPSLRTISLASGKFDFLREFSQEERTIVKALAVERSLNIIC